MLCRWFLDGDIVAGNHGTELRLESVSRELHDKVITCEATNEMGKSEKHTTLEITCEMRASEDCKRLGNRSRTLALIVHSFKRLTLIIITKNYD